MRQPAPFGGTPGGAHDETNRSQPDDQPAVRLGGCGQQDPVLTGRSGSHPHQAPDGDLRQASRHGPHAGLFKTFGSRRRHQPFAGCQRAAIWYPRTSDPHGIPGQAYRQRHTHEDCAQQATARPADGDERRPVLRGGAGVIHGRRPHGRGSMHRLPAGCKRLRTPDLGRCRPAAAQRAPVRVTSSAALVAVGLRLAHWQGQAEFATGQPVHRAAPAT